MIHKYDVNMKKNDFTTFLGEKYIKICAWMPWIVLVLLIATTLIGPPYKEIIIYSTSAVVLLNAVYLSYRFIVYVQNKRKKDFRG